uniref:polymeric immunoglobulin receptor-like n=1 Tax=Oncorhynchus gorbuscha TaxID=8017 RepID=UPI001EAF2918|nr:polymeric immunoglobulin receptor-like [Oncorhynchus gorbuscha]
MGSELHENVRASLEELKNHVSLYAIGGANASLMGLDKITGCRENVFFVQKFSGDVSITDDPSQHVFTVTMQNLQTQDTGEYVCAVDNGRNNGSISVTDCFPDVSVRSNMVSGREGNSTTAECLYSDMDDSEKMWCWNGKPAGNWSSRLTAEGERASQDRMDMIITTWRRTFTVTMRHLEMNDNDWYWCIAGDKQIPVYISVLNASNASISPPTMNLITFPLVLTLRATEDDNSRWW